MSRRIELEALSALHALSTLGRAVQFERALANPAEAQLEVLRRILSRNAQSEYGRAHGFARIHSADDFQRRVPVISYEDARPFVDRIAAGESGVLTVEPIIMFERTSGSTGLGKLIPFTRSLLSELGAGTAPWLFNLFRKIPGLRDTTSYWSISQAVRSVERTAGGIPIGFEDDASYFGPLEKWLISRLLAVPSDVARAPDLDTWRNQTLVHLLSDRNLGLISIWSPSFLGSLLSWLDDHFRELVGCVKDPGRRDELRGAQNDTGAVDVTKLWPRLGLVSCWGDGSSTRQLELLRRRIPSIPIQPKGILATEGIFSIPYIVGGSREPGFLSRGGVAAIRSHFLELLPLEAIKPEPIPIWEARAGAIYSPILTTGGGLYRYRLMDAVRCTGHIRATPTFVLEGRVDGGADLVGEKLTPAEVERAFNSAALSPDARFVMLCPVPGESCHYELLLETDRELEPIAERLDRKLREQSYHYNYARDLGQLGPVQARRISNGLRSYTELRMQRGAKLGEIKVPSLASDPEVYTALLGERRARSP